MNSSKWLLNYDAIMKLEPVSPLLGDSCVTLSWRFLINFWFLISSHLYLVICPSRFLIVIYFSSSCSMTYLTWSSSDPFWRSLLLKYRMSEFIKIYSKLTNVITVIYMNHLFNATLLCLLTYLTISACSPIDWANSVISSALGEARWWKIILLKMFLR